MAMIKCPDCGKEFSSYAKACPECGCPVDYCKSKSEYAESFSLEQGEEQFSPSQIATVTVNYDDIFIVKEDEFEGEKIVYSEYDMSGNQELDRLSDSLGVRNPCVAVFSIVNKEGTRFYIHYDESDLIESLDNDEKEPCKGIFVIIDDETLRIEAEGDSIFPIEQDQILRLCHASTIKFKIFKREGKAIVIQGTKEDEETMIASIQSLYDYTTGNRLFPDAAVKIQRWINNIRAKHAEMERKQEEERSAAVAEVQTEGTINIIVGIGLTLSAVVVLLIAIDSVFLLHFSLFFALPPAILGQVLIIRGILKKSGSLDRIDWNRVESKVNEIASYIKH